MSASPGTDTTTELDFDVPPTPLLTPTLASALLHVIKNSLPDEDASAGAVAGSRHSDVIAS